MGKQEASQSQKSGLGSCLLAPPRCLHALPLALKHTEVAALSWVRMETAAAAAKRGMEGEILA